MINILPNWHPVFVHFTIGLLFMAVVFYLAATLIRRTHPWRQQWLITANWCLWIGLIFAVITAIAGWFAYNSVAHDSMSHAAMTTHRNWALSTLVLFLLIGLWSILLVQKNRKPGKLFLTFALIAAMMLTITGWYGGEAVYRYGLGVISLPDTNEGAHGHDHSHDDKSVNTHAVESESSGHESENSHTDESSSDIHEQEKTDHDHNHRDEHQHFEGHDH